MEGRADTGVKNFFDDYGKGGDGLKPVQVQEKDSIPARNKQASRPPKRTTVNAEKVKARVGRPPGIANGSRSQKEKATMHINAALLDFYRDWSWEARCNLGELIERAMLAYKRAQKGVGDQQTGQK